RVVCLDPAELAFRGFVWKLGLFYADGGFDKSQRLECIVGKTVIIRDRYPEKCSAGSGTLFSYPAAPLPLISNPFHSSQKPELSFYQRRCDAVQELLKVTAHRLMTIMRWP
ncbi:MAG TPA: hypothetical protein VGC62_04965, partial [Pseudomonas sp.]|uniref:hypothetical protein n=1 Tax=Pseudomonas sp. TaxID=306 RepID=UPI002ED7B5A4